MCCGRMSRAMTEAYIAQRPSGERLAASPRPATVVVGTLTGDLEWLTIRMQFSAWRGLKTSSWLSARSFKRPSSKPSHKALDVARLARCFAALLKKCSLTQGFPGRNNRTSVFSARSLTSRKWRQANSDGGPRSRLQATGCRISRIRCESAKARLVTRATGCHSADRTIRNRRRVILRASRRVWRMGFLPHQAKRRLPRANRRLANSVSPKNRRVAYLGFELSMSVRHARRQKRSLGCKPLWQREEAIAHPKRPLLLRIGQRCPTRRLRTTPLLSKA